MSKQSDAYEAPIERIESDQQQLARMVEANNIEAARILLYEMHIDPTQAKLGERDAFTIAHSLNNPEMCMLLWELYPPEKKSIRLMMQETDGQTLLHITTQAKDKAVLERMLKGITPAHAASEEIGQTLLAYKVDANDIEAARILLYEMYIDPTRAKLGERDAFTIAHSLNNPDEMSMLLWGACPLEKKAARLAQHEADGSTLIECVTHYESHATLLAKMLEGINPAEMPGSLGTEPQDPTIPSTLIIAKECRVTQANMAMPHRLTSRTTSFSSPSSGRSCC